VQRRDVVVAIDGPSGSGKSTVARAVATAAGLRYLDTGAMYRAVTWLALRDEAVGRSPEDLAALAERAVLSPCTDPAAPGIRADGVDVSLAVRSAEVTAAVSAVSAVPGVRAAMVRRQQELIATGGIVVEGRDIGTTVAPDAELKVFLTADASTRALRRTRQDESTEEAARIARTEAELRRRDTADSSRTASPLVQPADAVVIDSSALDVDEVVRTVLERLRESRGRS
jgi:cytidylate kinase